MKKTKRNKYKYFKQNLNSGQALLIAVVFFMFISMVIVSGFSYTVTKEIKVARRFLNSRWASITAETGVEDIVYRSLSGMNYDNQETLSFNGSTVITDVSTVSGNVEIVGAGLVSGSTRKSKAVLVAGSGASFNYGVQSGDGGVDLNNTASIGGNLFSNGPITGSSKSTVAGTVVSAGVGGLVDDIASAGTAYADTITDSNIGGDAYYDSNISGTTVFGNSYSGQTPLDQEDLPITDATIAEWEALAEAGGVIDSPECDGGEYKINSDTTIGPIKINCDLVIEDNNIILTLAGPVWVVGKVELKKPTVRIDPAAGNKSIFVIADDSTNRTTSSNFNITNSTVFQGTGGDKSYILLVSMNNSAELGGGESAIEVLNGAFGDLLTYAPHGKILLGNQVSLKEVTGYKIILQQNAEVVYETGLANLLFEEGPGGGYELTSWEEI